MPESRPDRTDPSAVVRAHRGGVLVVLGAPGTGRTTLAGQLVVDRVREGSLQPDEAVVLAPTRRAAGRLRAQVTSAVGAASTEPLARTPAALAFSVLRRRAVADVAADHPDPRLLSGPEQDVILRDLLEGHAQTGSGPRWPPALQAALGTAGFRSQLRDLLMRCAEHGVEPEQLGDLGRRHDRPEWVAAATVLQEYDQVTALSSPGAFDPAWIGTAAADALEDDPELRAQLQARSRLIVVDDAHELTASAARLVRVLHHGGAELALLADPDSTTQGFRGAQPGLFARLAVDAAHEHGHVVRTLVLTRSWRQQAEPAAVSASVSGRIGAPAGARHRGPAPAGPGGTVETALLGSRAQESAFVAQTLRAAHLLHGAPWSQMAVLARGRGSHDGLRRALAQAGVPTRATGRSAPLHTDPAVRPLLLAYDLAVGLTRPDGQRPTRSPAAPDDALELVTSVLGGADPVRLRRLRRAVLAADRAEGVSRPMEAGLVDRLEQEALAASPLPVPDPDLEPLQAVGRVVAAAVRVLRGAERADAHAVLWALWQASGLAAVWEHQAGGRGHQAARADRDLDAVLVLFAAAEDYTERLPGRGADGFLDHVQAQEVAADSLADEGQRTEVVEVLTPQAAAGREWDLVAVVGVQDGVWPDLRLRDTLLGAQALTDLMQGRADEPGAAARAALQAVRDDESRQFHVAVSRARSRLLVTAVAGTEDQPSSLLDLVSPGAGAAPVRTVPAPLTARGLAGRLRRELVLAHRAADRPRRDQVAAELLRMADAGVAGALPGQWWDTRALSTSAPVAAPGRTVRVSPSQAGPFTECALRWLLTSRGAEAGRAPAAQIGSLVHEVVAEQPGADRATLSAELDRRWGELGLRRGWLADRERDRAEDMLARYLAYAATMVADGRTLVGTELALRAEVGPQTMVAGKVDRLERHPDGSLVVVDLKTGAPARAADVPRHPQLGAYQVAVVAGAFGADERPGGAVLANLGRRTSAASAVQAQPPLDVDPDLGWAADLLVQVATGMGGAQFPATTGSWCRTCEARFSCPAQPEGQER